MVVDEFHIRLTTTPTLGPIQILLARNNLRVMAPQMQSWMARHPNLDHSSMARMNSLLSGYVRVCVWHSFLRWLEYRDLAAKRRETNCAFSYYVGYLCMNDTAYACLSRRLEQLRLVSLLFLLSTTIRCPENWMAERILEFAKLLNTG